jgi:hypothetical protein
MSCCLSQRNLTSEMCTELKPAWSCAGKVGVLQPLPLHTNLLGTALLSQGCCHGSDHNYCMAEGVPVEPGPLQRQQTSNSSSRAVEGQVYKVADDMGAVTAAQH